MRFGCRQALQSTDGLGRRIGRSASVAAATHAHIWVRPAESTRAHAIRCVRPGIADADGPGRSGGGACWRPSTACMQQVPAGLETRMQPDARRQGAQTLTAWAAQEAGRVGGGHDAADFALLFSALGTAAKRIAFAVAQANVAQLAGGFGDGAGPAVGAGRDAPKKLDIVANELMKAALAATGLVSVLASEEDDEAVVLDNGGRYVAVFDPLDGSRNIECSMPTGTIFGIYTLPSDQQGAPSAEAALQPGSQLLASGYALYSSATMLVATLGGGGAAGFTLDSTVGEFVVTHPDLRIPRRGQIYSLNDARYHDWPLGLRKYVDTIRQGRGQNPKQYSARYVCSLVADFHRTLIYGGWAANPRSHLRLVYEANPLSFLVENAGGKGSDGRRRILDIQPAELHQRLPLFLGSTDDIEELESYGDVQQTSAKKYEV